MAHKIRTVFLDLDGTLADTAPDLAFALNVLLREEGRPELPFEHLRPAASHGSPGLLKLGFGIDPETPGYMNLRERLLAIYQANLLRTTGPFPEIPLLLQQLHERGITWGVVTNKLAFLAEPLVAELALEPPPLCVVSGDTTAYRKPHPEPMLHACRMIGSAPAACVYVGDAERDILAGQEAGMRTVVALYGYIGDEERPRAWGADGAINAPLELLDWIDDRN